MVKTIFYFADNLPFEDYLEQLRDGDIACRTIVFAKEQKSIYMGGEMYGGWDDDMFRRVLIRVLNNDDVINALIQFIKNNRNDLPIATKTDLGAIMVGAFLAITENGSLSVDINSLFGDASTIDKIKNIIKNYFSQQDPTQLPVASKESFGIVKIGDGLGVTNGTISVDFDSMSDAEREDLAEIVLNFIRTNSNFRASTTNYGVVKIAENGGISVNDGIIGVDTNTIVNNITNNNTFREYVENSYALPTASATQKGGVKIGSGLTMTGDVLSVNTDPSTGGIDYSITDLILTGTTLSIIQNGVSITEDLSSLVSAGADGKDGKDGKDGQDGQDGKDGKSAYEIAVENGFTGTVEEWLNSLKGQDGQNGTNGRDGQDGQDGKDGVDGKDGRDGVDGKDGQDGYTPTIDDQQLITVIEYVINNHEGGQQGGSEVDIEEIVNEVINVLNTKPWGEIFTSNGWSDAINAYLQQIGLIGQEVDEQGNRITKYNYSEMIQKIDEISSKVDSIELFTDENGNMITIEDLYSRIDQTVNNHTAITALEAKLAQWETDGPVVESVWSTTVNKVSNLDNRLTALAEQQASVIDQDSYTLSLLHLTADETSSMASLTSSYGDYFFDENGNPIYEEDVNGNVIYNRDEDGKAIPYTGVILKYLDADGNELPDNHTIDQRVPYKKEIKNGDEIAFQNLTDKNGNIIYRQRAIKVYYLADSNGNYIDNTQYVRADDINNGDITWSVNSNYKDIDGNSLKVINYSGNIAYHKKRKFKLRSEAGFITRSNAEDALSEQFAKYNDVQRLRDDLSTVSTKADANSAAVQAIARNTVYESRNNNGTIEFKWRDDNGYEQWSDRDLSNSGYHKVVNTSSNAGLGIYVDDKISQSSIFADYVTKDALESKKYATVQAVTDAQSAAITAAATATFYESRKNNDTIEFKWVRGDEVDWSADKPQGEGWSKVIREQNRAGLSSYVDDKIANSTLSTQLDGIRSEISTKVGFVDGKIQSGIKLNADQIDLNGQTTFLNAVGNSITVKSLEATDGTGTTTVNGNGFFIEGVQSESAIRSDGSGYFADGAISWGTNGDVTIGGNTTISGTLNGATGTFSGSLSGATGTFNSLSSANGNIQLKPTSIVWNGYNWMGIAIAINGDQSGDLATIGARINHNGYDYGRLVLVKRQTGTTGTISDNNVVELNANDRSISAAIIKDNAGVAVAMPNNIQYDYCTLPTYPVDGQFVFCIHCARVRTGGLYYVYNPDYTSAGTSTVEYDEPKNIIFVFGTVPGTNTKGWHIFYCG